MVDTGQIFFGFIEFLAYLIFLFVYAGVIDPAWSLVDAETHWLLGNNPQAQQTYDSANGIIDKAGQIEDTRTLIHKMMNLVVFPIAPIGIIGRRMYSVINDN